MKNLLFALLILLGNTASAQFIQDVDGRPYQAKRTEIYEGSPLLFDDWVTAKVVAGDGKVYENMLINVDLYQGMPLFFKDGKVYTFTADIKEFTLVGEKTKMTFKKGQLIDSSLPNVYFEVVKTNPLVLKNISKKLVEVQSYGSANKQYKFQEEVLIYAAINGKLQKLSLAKARKSGML